MYVIKRSGRKAKFDIKRIRAVINKACKGLPVKPLELEGNLTVKFYDQIHTTDIQAALIDVAKTLVTVQDPEWTLVAGRLLMADLHRNIFHRRGRKQHSLLQHINRMIEMKAYDPRILTYYSEEEIEKIGGYIEHTRDNDFDIAGVRKLISRYLVCDEYNHPIELPQEMFMLCAMWLSAQEEDKLFYVRTIYNALSQRKISLSTPILIGLRRPEANLTSCFVTQIDDNLESIFYTVSQCAQISKNGGGVGVDISKLRAKGSWIKGNIGKSGGVLPWVKILNDTAVAVNQQGKRAGAFTIALKAWHADLLGFLDCQSENGEQRVKSHDIFPQIVVPDLFMQRVLDGGDWTLFCPHEIVRKKGIDLNDYYGEEFEQIYHNLEQESASFKLCQVIPAREIYKKITKTWTETGRPYLTFIDEINRKNPNKDAGMIPCFNLCLSGGTRVLTEKGYEKLKDISSDRSIVVDKRLNGRSELVLPKKGPHMTSEAADVFTVEMEDGSRLECTEYHKFPIYNEFSDSYRMEHLFNLKAGDKIYLHENTEVEGTMHAPDEAYLIGLIFGDGSIYPPKSKESSWSVSLGLYEDKISLKSKADKKLKNLGIEVNWLTQNYSNKKEVFNSTKVGSLLQEIGATDKSKVPEFLFKSDKETILQFLEGLYEADGTTNIIENKKGAPTISIQLSSNKRRFLEDVKIILSMIGVRSRINSGRKEGYYKLPDSSREYKNYLCKAMWRLDINGNNAWKFHDQVDWKWSKKIEEVKNIRLDLLGRYESRKRENWTTKIKSITYKGVEPVYCVTEEVTSSAIFNGIVTGNCVESSSNVMPTKFKKSYTPEGLAITETQLGHTHSCNLASLNGANIIEDEWGPMAKLCTRILNNTIDLTTPPIPEAKKHNNYYRTIGVGVLGWADWLAKNELMYTREDGVKEAGRIFEEIALSTYEESVELAKTRGTFGAYPKSELAKGILLGKTLNELKDLGQQPARWEALVAAIKEHGILNSQCVSPAPNTSSALVQGTCSSILPVYKRMFVDESGDQITPITAKYLRDKRWFYPEQVTTHPKHIVDMCAEMQKWVDTSISMELVYNPNHENMSNLSAQMRKTSMYAWKMKCKTVYYQRTVVKKLDNTGDDCVMCAD